MAKVMTPSERKPITKGQITKLYDVLVNALVKSGLPSGPVQQVLQTRGAALADEFVASLRKAVDAISEMLTRRVTVDRTRSPQQALEATGRTQHIDKNVVATMPRGQSEEELFFFNLRRYVSDNELEQEYAARGLKPASPFSLAKVNEDDPAFADEHPNGTQWKDADGTWCFATFDRWRGERSVLVYRNVSGWRGCWWFAGVRK